MIAISLTPDNATIRLPPLSNAIARVARRIADVTQVEKPPPSSSAESEPAFNSASVRKTRKWLRTKRPQWTSSKVVCAR